VRLDIRAATLERLADGTKLTGSPLPEFVLEILAGGGLLARLVKDGYIEVNPAGL
jgi:hypothetical protein